MIRTAVRAAARVVALAALATVLLIPGTASAHPRGGVVLPPDARPMGYSLTDMAREVAPFTASGNDPAYAPRTPFQLLYFDPATEEVATDDGGWAFSGTNAFTVASGTVFYVPLQNADDSPPVLGTFPRSRARAVPYFFRQSQLGARDYTIVIDGNSTSIGPRYLAGPVTTPPLPDGGGTHMITLAAFLGPLSPGKHTIHIFGGLHGDLLCDAYEIDFLTGDFSYTVTVLPPKPRKHR